MSVRDRVVETIGLQMGVAPDQLRLDSSIVGEIESPDSVELIMELEEEFGITIPDQDAVAVVTVGQAIQYFEDHIS